MHWSRWIAAELKCCIRILVSMNCQEGNKLAADKRYYLTSPLWKLKQCLTGNRFASRYDVPQNPS